ncbi:penicillin-insensitive murein endopeptidase [Vibrio panuliri]|uniref:Penicillin-insensitive murein endopeptidase n=1 Tax=Vibrio panuliri TaxID=1381081 RepID=A0A1Q9HCU0_9VIBR|nr:penicillin-insensitive murein endopeptidase [Vibrio panuliri]OLQ87184.1 penicillin-insensitive murein endopeptidase [Vibrio panuliri]
MKMTWAIFLTLFWSFSLFASPWESFSQPNRLSPEAIGSYANGCLLGAKALPLNGHGYQVLRSQNKRYYGHPNTIAFIERLSSKARSELRTHILIGDMSLPQGGRFSSGHTSHQTGLDADIWFRLADTKLSSAQLSLPKPKTLVDMSAYKLSSANWDNRHFRLVKMAAQDNEVARIFVHPVIKDKLCSLEGANRDWLRKVRPWWGHNYHMHVRLRCPQGDANCVDQKPPPKGDGCGAEVASWKPAKAHNVKNYRGSKTNTKVEKSATSTTVKVKSKPKKFLPRQCTQLIDHSK